MDLPLAATLKIGVQTIHRRTEPAPGLTTGRWLPTTDELRAMCTRLTEQGAYLGLARHRGSQPAELLDQLLRLLLELFLLPCELFQLFFPLGRVPVLPCFGDLLAQLVLLAA